MGKLMLVALGAAILFGCRSVPPTPEKSWAMFNAYYAPTGVQAVSGVTPTSIETVQSSQLDATVARYKAQGLVDLGTLLLDDGTEISYEDVQAFATKINASMTAWSIANSTMIRSTLPNSDMGIPGTDYTQAGSMVQTRADESMAEHTVRKHTIRFFGKAAK